MTIRIFDSEPYTTKYLAEVTSCEKTMHDKNEVYSCKLNETIFFPEEGGQSPDRGMIDGLEVIDVQVEGEDIIHYLASPIEVGSSVQLVLDWVHRFSNMQQHSGEHIFSGLVHKMYGYDNVGFHLSDNSVTMDFNNILGIDKLMELEYLVNEAIAKNVPITAEYVDDETLKNTEYRSKKEIDGAVRLVTIEGYDVCACCAPHVKRTGEIGGFKIIHSMNYKGGVRVEFRCGFRALECARENSQIVDSLTAYLSTSSDKLLEQVTKIKEENALLQSQLLEAKKTLLMQELESIPAGEKDVILFKEKTDNLLMKIATNYLADNHAGVSAFFSGDDENGYNYMLVSRDRDTREVQKILNEKLSARGGGKPEMVTGSVKAAEESIREVLEREINARA